MSLLIDVILYLDSQEAAYQEANPSLGIIKVIIERVNTIIGSSTPDPGQHKITIDEAPIHESKKNLGGHRVKWVWWSKWVGLTLKLGSDNLHPTVWIESM